MVIVELVQTEFQVFETGMDMTSPVEICMRVVEAKDETLRPIVIYVATVDESAMSESLSRQQVLHHKVKIS